jgi:drug/metabolite transporter (DMT)-like permease
VSLGLTALVLLAALMHAAWNALVKTGRDGMMTLFIMTAIGSLLVVPGLFFVPFPHRDSWVFLLLSSMLHWGYYFGLIQGYRAGDLSHVYPIARGSAPLMVSAGAYAFAGESLSAVGLLGLALASGAIVSLAFASARSLLADPYPYLYGLLTAACIASYTVVDGLGVRAAGNPLSYILWLFVIDGPLVFLVLLKRRPGRIVPYLREYGGGIAIAAAMANLAYGIVIFAMASAPMAFVSALRESSVIFAAILGAALLKEAFGAWRIVASVVVVLGVALLHLAG